MREKNVPGLKDFLINNPGLRIVPSGAGETTLKGQFCFTAEKEGFPPIEDYYQLEIAIPATFPRTVPSVKEIGDKIPRDGEHHLNPGDDTLCLGSPLRLQLSLGKDVSITSFVNQCLVPYLYAISHKLQFGELPWGELDHGKPGIIQDYMELFGVTGQEGVISTLNILGKRKRVANKKPCPCGCGQRLGKCDFRWKIIPFRKNISRKWFQRHTLQSVDNI